ncbi:MAG: hypothetical protein KKD86_13380 [Bacteroidetes bacterium]|nr:hypothetical protein [Bacteroidota bacterium]
MKNIFKIILTISFGAILVFTACEDRSDLTAPKAANTGTADFSRYVALGNSLTAGYQSSSLFESAQEYSYPNLIAQQVNTSLVQPLVSDPGIGGRLQVADLVVVSGEIANVVLESNATQGTPKNSTYSKPYNNLGIPGAILYDLVDSTDFATKYVTRGNPFFSVVLRDAAFGKTVIKQANLLQPTFITLWIGNNDVLGYATSGGTKGTDLTGKLPTETANFTALFNLVAATLDTNAKVAVANIPDVANIPYFTTIGPAVGLGLQGAMDANPAVVGLFYQKSGEIVASGLAQPTDLYTGKVLMTLPAGSYASLLGQSSDKFYTDNGITPPPGIDTNQPFGLHPQNPIPDVFVLDESEQAKVTAAVTSFNTTIAGIAGAKSNWILVDMNTFFDEVKDLEKSMGGMYVNGIKFTTEFISGNTFSLDGVHPSSQGYAVVANKFIEEINKRFSAAIPLVNVATIPGSLPLSKKQYFEKLNIHVDLDALKNVSYW